MAKVTSVKPVSKRSVQFALDLEDIGCSGYTTLDKNPEVMTAVHTIAELISSMTIYLMANTENGDKRITNALSRKIDINPNSYMTRKTWMESIVMNLLLYGKGNSIVLPITKNGQLDNLIPVEASKVSFSPVKNAGTDSAPYVIVIGGKQFSPDEILHFVYNPDKNYLWKGQGLTTTIKDVCDNLKQAGATKKAFMSSKFKPSVIVKVDALADEFSSPEGRKKLADSYLNTTDEGEPWIIPAEQFSVEQVKPLSLSDLAINDAVVLDKKTVAAIIGVPAFLLGVGEFNQAEYNNFVNTKVRSIAAVIEQEMTKKLIISDKWYWKFNIASLYAYDIKSIAGIYGDWFARGIVTGNECRDKLSLSPKDGLDELVILENYIPIDMVGMQKKLNEIDE